MGKNLEVLVKHRDAILIAEIGALLHDLGKLDERFIIQTSIDGPGNFKKYKHEKILKDLLGLKKLLSNNYFTDKLAQLGDIISELAPSNRRSDLSLDRFISKHHDDVSKSPIGYYKLISPSTGGVDGIDSGIDKSAASGKAKQSLANTYIATVFGFEEKYINAKESILKSLQNEFVKVLNSELQKKIIDGLVEFAKVRPLIMHAAKKAFIEALGETRRAANDVTLWDHSYSVASLYKAALAKILLDDHWIDPCKFQWRFLHISIDGLSFLNSAHRVTDILGRRKAVIDALNKVKELIEIEYPLGNEIYRDENGSAFLVPDVSDLSDRVNKDDKSLQELIQDAFAKSDLKEEIKLILSPQAFSDASRGAILLGKLLSKSPSYLTTDPNVVKEWWRKAEGAEVCTVCSLRPMGYNPDNPTQIDEKAKDRHVCKVCLERRGRRSQEWATKELDSTIWIDEVADINARVALIVGRFQLDDWLNGAFTDTIFTQSLTLHNLSYDQIINGLKEALEGKDIDILDRVGGDAWGYFKRERKLSSNSTEDEVKCVVREFYQLIVEERDARGLSKNVSTLEDKAMLFGLFLFHKYPSFARLRRIWETTQKFWVNVAKGRGNQASLIAKVVGQVGPRLKITVTDIEKLDLGPYHAYELILNGVRLSVIWASYLNEFIIADNLCYMAKLLGAPEATWRDAEEAALFVKSKLSGEIKIEEPPGYGTKAKKIGTLKDIRAEIMRDDQGQSITYVPAIPILTEPRTFVTLVPAKKALEIVAKIKKKYEFEMGKVRNRLPLCLGIIYFHRRTPLRAALEAGQQMLKMQGREEIWRVKEKRPASDEEKARYEGKLGAHVQYLNLQDPQGREMPWLVSYSLGDNSQDYYYPYFFVKAPTQVNFLNQRSNRFESYRPTPNGKEKCWLVHVGDLEVGDEVWVTPSRFDFEFLDTSARRFEIIYDDGRRRSPRKTRPYLLEDLDILSQIWELLAGKNGLTTTQIDALISLIEAKRERWHYPTGEAQKDKAFGQLVHDALTRADWPDGWMKIAEKDRALLEKAAISGVLSDVLELYMKVMKEEPKRK